MKRKLFLYIFLLLAMLGLASCSKETYTISFDSNFGTAVESIQVNENELVVEPAAPTREGYTFEGWYIDINFTQEVNFETFIPTKNITLFAKWTKNEDNNDNPNIPDNGNDGNEGNDKPSIVLPEGGEETPTIYLAGDSTVKTYDNNQYIAGWGQYLGLFLDSNISVVNCANGGRSSRSFINEGRLYDIDNSSFKYTFTQNNGKSIEDVIKAGDYLFIQFGHNDDNTKLASSYTTIYDRMVPLGEPDANGIYPTTAGTKTSTTSLPAAYTDLASSNEENAALTEIAKYGSEYYAYDCGGTYKWFLKQYIDFARSVDATPVLVTPVARVKYDSLGKTIIGGAGLHGENFAYVQAVRQLAEEENCLLIDLFADTKETLETATSKYGNYLMALKPNDLNGLWPAGYDSTYGKAELGYTGIEATHYNKYGSYLQAAMVIESILNNLDVLETSGEHYNFFKHILLEPEQYIDPSNLISKSTIEKIEGLLEYVNVTNPNRTYPDPSVVVTAIEALQAYGEVTNDNYLEIQAKCEEIRGKYVALNVDDISNVTNISVLEQYEEDVEAIIKANKPAPVKVVVYSADDVTTGTYTSRQTFDNGLTIVGGSGKAVTVEANPNSHTYNDVTYKNANRIKLGGSASFSSYRYLEITVEKACVVTIICKSGGSDTRTLNLVDSSNSIIGNVSAASSSSIGSIEITSAGTYKIGSAGSGINVYTIIVEYFE